MIARLLLAAALFAAAPAGAQTAGNGDSAVAQVGNWLARFAAASVEPSNAATICFPQISAAMSKLRDPASAQAAAREVGPCVGRIRDGYRKLETTLAKLEPLPASIEAASSFNSAKFIADQRGLAVKMVAYLDDIDRLIAAVAANDNAAARPLALKVRAGGALVVDSMILQARMQQSSSRLELARTMIELRIILAEAARLSNTGTPTPGGLSIGSDLRALAVRATTATKALGPSWAHDQALLKKMTGGRSNSQLDGVVAAGGEMAARSGQIGTEIAAALEKASANQVLSINDLMALMGELNRYEAELIKTGQSFAATLQTIG